MASTRSRRISAWLLTLCGLAGLGLQEARAQAVAPPRPPVAAKPATRPAIPPKVGAVLKAIDETGRAPAGVMGGRVYENQADRGEQRLPRIDRDGDPIAYQTWDVNPRNAEPDRGKERLVVGTDGSAYYTADYYKTFAAVRNPARSTLAGADPAPQSPPRSPPASASGSSRNAPARPAGHPVVALEPRLAARVMPVVDTILDRGEPPPGTVGGRDFRNLGLDDGEVLPRSDDRGRPIRYREWDVNKQVPGRSRGPERIVTGSDGRVYYTGDHYATFRRIR